MRYQLRLLRLKLYYLVACARVEWYHLQDRVREFTARCSRRVRLCR